MEAFDLVFFHEMSGATAVLTFTNIGVGSVRVNVSLRHDVGLTPLKMQRYVRLWQKWSNQAINTMVEQSSIPMVPPGWFSR